eukprot:7674408-Pyramimonas_sp.AAC.1
MSSASPSRQPVEGRRQAPTRRRTTARRPRRPHNHARDGEVHQEGPARPVGPQPLRGRGGAMAQGAP